MILGGGIALAGILITGLTMAVFSSGGGFYIVTWGAILFGGLYFVQGLMKL